jgi:hypothetical protein
MRIRFRGVDFTTENTESTEERQGKIGERSAKIEKGAGYCAAYVPILPPFSVLSVALGVLRGEPSRTSCGGTAEGSTLA